MQTQTFYSAIPRPQRQTALGTLVDARLANAAWTEVPEGRMQPESLED